ncbi:hypothetical protein D9613_002010 [Agrocybe pediades]|uniref:Copper-fist domain-containing protein n=1 Tax=Agrocybe pediades TaxID=84607 RepID=A0A8H4R4Q7_9AGAR|nr:hypothetical protein D9613_002010 [Agrocybe pediades]
MVYVNSQKFACESCIKGHRSSSCHHTDRPLFEIKKKGRPVSQCTKCRELRQSKKFHSKCTCNHQSESAPAMQPLASGSGSKTRRFIPIVPALPNGLRDVLPASTARPPDSRQRVDALLNPCDCKSVWKCKCSSHKAPAPASSLPGPTATKGTDALSALAHVAALQCCPSPPPKSSSLPGKVVVTEDNISRPTRFRSPSPVYTSSKRQKQDKLYRNPSPGPALAPLLYTDSLPEPRPTKVPDFPLMPPMSSISSLAGSGCTCGFQCSCPGCVEHRGKAQANPDRKDCADGCGTCIDHSLGMSLPSANVGTAGDSSKSGTSILDRFFARAAALPPPPAYRKMTSNGIDPMDTTRYTDFSRPQGTSAFDFGVVQLPKLECCGGQCNCPAGRCTCRVSCAGCCTDDKKDSTRNEAIQNQAHPSLDLDRRTAPVRSCCAGKG